MVAGDRARVRAPDLVASRRTVRAAPLAGMQRFDLRRAVGGGLPIHGARISRPGAHWASSPLSRLTGQLNAYAPRSLRVAVQRAQPRLYLHRRSAAVAVDRAQYWWPRALRRL